MERQVVIQVTDEMLERMLRPPLWRAILQRSALLTLVVVGMTLLICWRKGAGPAGMILWPVGAALVMAGLAYVDYRRLRRAAMAPYRRLADRGLTYRFTDKALEIGTIDSYSICRWEKVRRIGKYREGWCLYFGPAQFVVVPAEALDDETRALMEAAVGIR